MVPSALVYLKGLYRCRVAPFTQEELEISSSRALRGAGAAGATAAALDPRMAAAAEAAAVAAALQQKLEKEQALRLAR